MMLFRRLRQCRRGTISLMVSIAAIPMIGLVGFGTEAGAWYLVRRHAQNAADAAAYAGAYALIAGNNATTKAKEFATRNGFTDGTTLSYGATQAVTIATTATSVTATVKQFQPPIFVRLFGRSSNVLIQATATGQIQNPEKVCALGLHKGNQAGLEIGGNQKFRGGNCALASNTNVKFDGPPTFNGT